MVKHQKSNMLTIKDFGTLRTPEFAKEFLRIFELNQKNTGGVYFG